MASSRRRTRISPSWDPGTETMILPRRDRLSRERLNEFHQVSFETKDDLGRGRTRREWAVKPAHGTRGALVRRHWYFQKQVRLPTDPIFRLTLIFVIFSSI